MDSAGSAVECDDESRCSAGTMGLSLSKVTCCGEEAVLRDGWDREMCAELIDGKGGASTDPPTVLPFDALTASFVHCGAGGQPHLNVRMMTAGVPGGP